MSCSIKSIRPKQWSHGLTHNPLLAEANPVHNSCFIGHMYFGCILYADDIILISPSNTGMQDMLDICDIEIKWLDMKFNVKKSIAMAGWSKVQRVMRSTNN